MKLLILLSFAILASVVTANNCRRFCNLIFWPVCVRKNIGCHIEFPNICEAQRALCINRNRFIILSETNGIGCRHLRRCQRWEY